MEDDLPTGTGLTLPVGGSATANIQFDGDIDAFSVTLEAGETYQFDVTGISFPALFDPVLSLGDGTGARIDQNDDFGGSRDPRIEFTASISGEYFLYVEGFGSSTGNFQISATQTSQPPFTTFDDYPTGTSGFLSVGSFSTGNIETATDIDSFRVDLVEGFTYRLTARGSDTADGTLADPVLELFDPSGEFTADNDSGFGRNAELSSFVAPSTGSYEIRVYSADFSSTGTYFVSASQTAEPPVTTFDDYPTGTTGSVSVGGSTFGNIETSGDVDRFSVGLEGGVTYQFDLVENSDQGGVTLNPFLRLVDGQGNAVAANDNGGVGNNARIEFTPDFFGFYFLDAQGSGSSTGLYELSVTEETTPPTTSFDDYPTGTTGTVTVGQSTSGNIETVGDTDRFSVFLQADFTYQIDLISSTDSGIVSLSDPFLRLTDSAGDIFITNNNGGSGLNSRITDFTPSSSGIYFLDAEGSGSSTGVYEISATQTGSSEPTTPGPTTPGPVMPGPVMPIIFTQDTIDEIMTGIRDFDGNQFGAAASWQLIGQTDIQGDGDIELILVNSDLGRWATLGVQEDGTIDFSANGFGGDTRVVGIYIDPLVESGVVQRGSGNDSQTRFQNDLLSGNLNSVLGADDYDGDGFQEVYFGLADGGAVLHAYMHADGNIRYSNYQSEADLISFMQINGVSTSVYDDWFS